jgi:predicted aminopeptidase
MKKMLKSLLRVCFYFLLSCMISACYIFQQAVPFLTHHIGARSNEKLIEDGQSDPVLIEFLKRVEDIRVFAGDELGLEETDNYTRFYSIDRDYLAAVIQAAPEFSIEPYLFKYPVFGSLPYKGFYNPDHARKEAEKLKAEGLDVFIRPVDAFSSLGYFRDPLFSFMTDYSSSRLADLIIHEQTHATIFIKGEPEFNEKLATIVGREGARQYIISRFGESSDEYAKLLESRQDSERFTRDMIDLGQRLVAVYVSDLSIEEKRKEKRETIEEFQIEFGERYDERYTGDGFRDAGNMELNNAYLSLFELYEEPDGRLQQLLEQTGGIAEMVRVLTADLEDSKTPPWDVVDRLLIE